MSESSQAMRSAMRKMKLALAKAGIDSDALEQVRATPLTESEQAAIVPFLQELDEIIRRLRESG